MAKVDWNTKEYETSAPRNFDPIPKGRYLCQIDDTEMKDTKDKTGSYLEVTMTVVLPKEHKGRKLWARLNVNNKSEVAQRIGREQFNALAMAACNTLELRDTSKLHLKKVVAHVSIERGGQERDDQNRINGFEPYVPQQGGAAPSEQKAQPPVTPPQQPAPTPLAGSQGGKVDDFEDDIPF